MFDKPSVSQALLTIVHNKNVFDRTIPMCYRDEISDAKTKRSTLTADLLVLLLKTEGFVNGLRACVLLRIPENRLRALPAEYPGLFCSRRRPFHSYGKLRGHRQREPNP